MTYKRELKASLVRFHDPGVPNCPTVPAVGDTQCSVAVRAVSIANTWSEPPASGGRTSTNTQPRLPPSIRVLTAGRLIRC